MAWPATLAVLLVAGGAPAPAVGSFQELGAALGACLRLDDQVAGAEVTLRFALSPRGTILGRPAVLLARGGSASATTRSLQARALEALRRCTPFALTPEFGQVVAGRVLTLKLLTGGRSLLV